MVICLELGADLHMAQLMPLPLAVSCFSKIQIGFTFLLSASRVVPDKGPLNGCQSIKVFYSGLSNLNHCKVHYSARRKDCCSRNVFK